MLQGSENCKQLNPKPEFFQQTTKQKEEFKTYSQDS